MTAAELSELGAIAECLATMASGGESCGGESCSGDAEAWLDELVEARLPELAPDVILQHFAAVPGRREHALWRRVPAQGVSGLAFAMGSPSEEEGHAADESLVPVRLGAPFLVMASAVSFGQWRRFADNAAHAARWGEDPLLPVTHVDWFLACLFAHWLNHSRRRQPRVWAELLGGDWPDHRFALPSEAQREGFARAGTGTRFWSGDREADLARVGWFAGNSGDRLHRVAGKEANALGVFDVHGNVWEWCRDRYRDELRGGLDPLELERGLGRVLRGGSFREVARRCRAAYCYWFEPEESWDDIGFRLVLTAARGAR